MRCRLEAARCNSCGKIAYPALQICPECRGREWETVTLSNSGKVITSTAVHVPPNDLQMEGPYAAAVIETPEGARLMVQVVDCDPSKVLPGMEVQLQFRRVRRDGHPGILCYGYKGVPVG